MVRHPVAVAESIEQRCLEGDWFVRSPAYWKAQAAAAIHAGIPADLVASCETYMEKALLQWRLHMETCRHDTALLGCERVLDVRYEDFVSSPRDDLARILDFAQLHTAPELDTFCLERIKPRRMKTRRTLGQRERTIAGPLLDEFLEGADGIT